MNETLTAESVLDRLGAEVAVPVHTGVPVAQGDLLVIPTTGQVEPATTPIPVEGVALVRGNGGHTHLLLGHVAWSPIGGTTLGVVTVPDGEVGYVAHGDGTPTSALSGDADHDLAAFGPGTYVIRQQREYANEWRQVAD